MASMADSAETLHILNDFPAVPRETWENAIHIDLQGADYEDRGIRESWQVILYHRALQEAGGHLERRRQTQALSWMRELISSGLEEIFQNTSAVQERSARLEHSVRERTISPSRAARELLDLLPDLSPRPLTRLSLAVGVGPAVC